MHRSIQERREGATAANTATPIAVSSCGCERRRWCSLCRPSRASSSKLSGVQLTCGGESVSENRTKAKEWVVVRACGDADDEKVGFRRQHEHSRKETKTHDRSPSKSTFDNFPRKWCMSPPSRRSCLLNLAVQGRVVQAQERSNSSTTQRPAAPPTQLPRSSRTSTSS